MYARANHRPSQCKQSPPCSKKMRVKLSTSTTGDIAGTRAYKHISNCLFIWRTLYFFSLSTKLVYLDRVHYIYICETVAITLSYFPSHMYRSNNNDTEIANNIEAKPGTSAKIKVLPDYGRGFARPQISESCQT